MPSAFQIRKEILTALSENIIPALRRQGIPLGYVEPPFAFPAGIRARLLDKKVPRVSAADEGFPLQSVWPKANLLSTFHPYIGFLYEGEADERTLVTAAQASQQHISKGIYAIRWQAPSVLLFPPGTPRNGGLRHFWESSLPKPPAIKVLWLDHLETELLLHTHIEVEDQFVAGSHSLQIRDQVAMTLIRLFTEESSHLFRQSPEVAQEILLALMMRLHYCLKENSSHIANTSRPATPSLQKSLPKQTEAWQKAVIFIQLRLQEPLTLSLIAREVHLSATHLNRLFHQHNGISVMRYVRLQRIAAAKKTLVEGNENIGEIAHLLGFKRANAFCSAFKQETGLTPNQFRRQAKNG